MNDKDFTLKTWAHIHHADLYLKSKHLNYIHFPAVPWELMKYPVKYQIDNYHTNGINRVDNGHDDLHPGIETNKKTAELIYRILNEQNK
jgi:hypothetical protein